MTVYRCGHKKKTPLRPCILRTDCTRTQADLLELNTDLSDVRAAIRLYNVNRNSSHYGYLIDHIRTDFASYFGRGSTNGNNVMASLRDIESYLGEEINAIAENVTERVRSQELCMDNCWEGLVILGREAQGRGGNKRMP